MAVYAASFLDIRLATVTTCTNCTIEKVDKASLITKASIPKDGSAGAFGYGILTGDGEIVTTTHKGVLDSEAQNGNANNPVFHNHYMKLGNDARCGGNPAVVAIILDSPGKVSVGGSAVSLKDLPKSSEGQSQSQNKQVEGVVSFKLQPTDGAVCVTDIKPAKKVKVN